MPSFFDRLRYIYIFHPQHGTSPPFGFQESKIPKNHTPMQTKKSLTMQGIVKGFRQYSTPAWRHHALHDG